MRRGLAAMVAVVCVSVSRPAVADDGDVLKLTLQQALDVAAVRNLAYAAAQADVKAAGARLLESDAALRPLLSANYRYQHAQSPSTLHVSLPLPNGEAVGDDVLIGATDTNLANVVLQYVVYDGGARRASIGKAAAAYSAAQYELSAAGATMRRDVVTAYFRLVQARAVAAIADGAVTLAEAALSRSREAFAAGTVPRADVLRGQMTVAQAQSQQIAAHSDVSVANAALANVLNVRLSATIETAEPVDPAPVPDGGLSALVAGAEERRPELQAATLAVAIAGQAVAEARAGNLPEIGISVGEGTVRPNVFNVAEPQLTATLSATWNLLDGGLSRARAAEASAEVSKAQIELAQLRNAVDLETRQAYFGYVAARQRADASRSAASYAAEVLRLARLRYEDGVGTSLELADALLADTRAKTDVVDAEADVRIARAALDRATGS